MMMMMRLIQSQMFPVNILPLCPVLAPPYGVMPGCPHCRLSEIFAHLEQQRLDGLHCLWCMGVLNNIFGLPTLDSHVTQLVW